MAGGGSVHCPTESETLRIESEDLFFFLNPQVNVLSIRAWKYLININLWHVFVICSGRCYLNIFISI